MSDTTVEMPDGSKLKFPEGMSQEAMKKAIYSDPRWSKYAPASASHKPGQPVRSKEEARQMNAANIAASAKNQGITPQEAKAKGVTPAVTAAKTGHEDAASRAETEAALKATHDAQVYRLHGGGMGFNKAEQAKEKAAADASSKKFQAIRQDPGTLLNQIQPGFDKALSQQQGKKGAVYDKAAGLLNSVPDLALIGLTEGAAEIPEIAGQSLVTRGFQAQQVAGLAHEAADQKLRKEDPGKYYTSLLLGGLLAGAPDIMSHASKGLTAAVEDVKAKQTTNAHGGPSVSAKDAAAIDVPAKERAARIEREEEAAKAKRAADISRVKPVARPVDVPQVKPKSEVKTVETSPVNDRGHDLYRQNLAQAIQGAKDAGKHELAAVYQKQLDALNRDHPVNAKTKPIETKTETAIKTEETKPAAPPKDTAFKPVPPKAKDLPKKTPTDGHNTTNARAQQVRASMGLADLPKAQRQTWTAVVDHVEKTGMDRDTGNVADRVLKGGHAMSADEIMANNYRQHSIMHEVAELRDQIDEGIKAGHDVDAKKVQALELETEFEKLSDATKRTGTMTSQALNIRKATIPKYSYDAAKRRIFHADPAKPLTPEETATIKEQSDIITKGEKALADKEAKRVPPDEKRSQDAGTEAVTKMVRERKAAARTEKIADIKSKREELIRNFVRSNSQANAGLFNPESLPILRDIAKTHIDEGIVRAEALVDAVHESIKEHFPNATKREVRDALSGYDKDPVARKQSQYSELKTEMRLLSELEDAKAGVEREKKIAAARAKTPRIEALKQAIKGERAKTAAKPAPSEKPARTVKTPAEKRLQAQRTALGRQIEEYDRRIKNSDFSKKPGVSTPDHPDITALKGRRDALKAVYDSMKPSRAKKAPPTRLETMERQFKALKEKNAKGDYGTDRTKTPDTPEEAAMRAKLNAARREQATMRKAQSATPPKDPLGSYKKGLQKQLGKLNGELKGTGARGPKADPRQLDPEAEALKTDISKAQKKLDAMERNRQPKSFQDKFIAYRRFAALSRIGSWSKLGAAAGERVLFGPLEEVTGLPARYLTPNIERKAMTQGRPSFRAEKAAVNKYFTRQTWTKEAVDKFQTGRNSLDVRYGKDDYSEGEGEKPTILNMPGRLHGAIKTPAQMAAFERAQVKGTEWAERQGLDVSDPLVQGGIDARAYQESLRAILMQDNTATNLYKTVVNALERNEHPAGKAAATAMRAFMPIVKVPTNFAGEVGTHLAGGFRAAWEVKVAGGVKNLTPEQADIVLRSLKKQGVGGMMFAIGYFNPDKFGGTYVPRDKPKPGAPEYGGIRLPAKIVPSLGMEGWKPTVNWSDELPHNLLHNPAIEALQIGATWRRVQDEEIHKRASGHPFLRPIEASAYGAVENIPFFDFIKRGGQATEGLPQAEKAGEEEALGMAIPGFMSEAGALFNKDAQGKQIKRKPQGFWDEIKMAAGFQATVPKSSPSSRKESALPMNKDGTVKIPSTPGMKL
jgi:hypothetical protein